MEMAMEMAMAMAMNMGMAMAMGVEMGPTKGVSFQVITVERHTNVFLLLDCIVRTPVDVVAMAMAMAMEMVSTMEMGLILFKSSFALSTLSNKFNTMISAFCSTSSSASPPCTTH